MALCRLTHSCLCASVSQLRTDGVVVFRMLWQQDQPPWFPWGDSIMGLRKVPTPRYHHLCISPQTRAGTKQGARGVHEPAEASPEQSKGSRPRTRGICQPLCPGSAVCSPGQKPPALVTGTDHGHFWVVAPASHPRKSGTMGR